MIWNQNLNIIQQTISDREYTLLSQLQQGKTFAEVCMELNRQLAETEVATVAADSLFQWMRDGLILRIS